MTRIDGLLQHPAVEMQPGKLAVDEAFGAMGDRRTALHLRFFFFYYNGLRGFHEVQSIPGRTPAQFRQRRRKDVLSR